jgi:hypothetical protein
LQDQRRQRPLAALILKWLGNGHGARSTLASVKNLRIAQPLEIVTEQEAVHGRLWC